MSFDFTSYIGGKWELKKGMKSANALSGATGATFTLNPRRVTVTPKLRVSIQDTLDGRVIMPWIDPESETNVGSVDIVFEGVSNVYVKNIQGIIGKKALLKLFQMSMDSFMKERNGVLVREAWQLTCMTPVLYKRFGLSLDPIILLGYVTAPMEISESADSPWMPSWKMTFSIWGGQVEQFVHQFATAGVL